MTQSKEVYPPGAASVGVPLSPATRWGDLLFLSGMVAMDPATRSVAGATVEEQVTIIMEQMKALLASAGTGFEHVLKVTCYLADPADFAGWNATYGKYVTAAPPARTTIVAGFAMPGIKVEVEAIAGIPG